MLKKLLAIIAFLFYAAASFAANVDVNTASSADLDALKGIGPALSQRIIDARQQGGAFKDWSDLISRVKGIGKKNAVKFSTEGMTVGGAAYQGAPAQATEPKAAASAEKKQGGKHSKKAASAAAEAAAPAATAASAPQADASAAKKHGGRRSKKAASAAAAASAAQ
jgi:competence protein ComEA